MIATALETSRTLTGALTQQEMDFINEHGYLRLKGVCLPAKGHDYSAPFPMHQDQPFYPYQDGRYIDAIQRVDGADEDGRCLKSTDGSHKLGAGKPLWELG